MRKLHELNKNSKNRDCLTHLRLTDYTATNTVLFLRV